MNYTYSPPGQNPTYGTAYGQGSDPNSLYAQQGATGGIAGGGGAVGYSGGSQSNNGMNLYGAAPINNAGLSGLSASSGFGFNNKPGSGGGATGMPSIPQAPSIGTGNTGTGYSIPQLISMQMQQNTQAQQQNQANWSGAAGALQQYTTPFTPGVIAGMNTQNQQKLAGAQQNANTQQAGIMAADGQTDASSLAAAAQANQRNAMGAQVNAAQNLGIQAAQANNQAGFNVANSVISHLPQVKPTDYSGLMALSNQMQNQGFQNQMQQYNAQMAQQQYQQSQALLQNQLAAQQNAQYRPTTPMASGTWLGSGFNAQNTNPGAGGMQQGFISMFGNGGGGYGGGNNQGSGDQQPYNGPSNPFDQQAGGNQAWSAA